MVKLVGKVLERYGTRIRLLGQEETVEFRGFLQHTASRHWNNMEKVFAPLGQLPRGQYAVIAPADLVLKTGDVLECGGKGYRLRRVETVLFRDTPLYLWGLCVERGGGEA